MEAHQYPVDPVGLHSEIVAASNTTLTVLWIVTITLGQMSTCCLTHSWLHCSGIPVPDPWLSGSLETATTPQNLFKNGCKCVVLWYSGPTGEGMPASWRLHVHGWHLIMSHLDLIFSLRSEIVNTNILTIKRL